MGVSQNWGYCLGGPYNQDDSIGVSLLGSPYLGKLPNMNAPMRLFLSCP